MPPSRTVRRVSAGTVLVLDKSGFRHAAVGVVVVFGGCKLLPGFRVVVPRAVFFSACPAPRPATPRPNDKHVAKVEAARKHVVACAVLKAPPAAPRALFSITRPRFCRHKCVYMYMEIQPGHSPGYYF